MNVRLGPWHTRVRVSGRKGEPSSGSRKGQPEARGGPRTQGFGGGGGGGRVTCRMVKSCGTRRSPATSGRVAAHTCHAALWPQLRGPEFVTSIKCRSSHPHAGQVLSSDSHLSLWFLCSPVRTSRHLPVCSLSPCQTLPSPPFVCCSL